MAQDASKRAIGYVRVSTQKQADEGLSLNVQKARICAWAEMQGYTIDDIVIETESAKSISCRPLFKRTIERCVEQKIALVAVKLDRMARNTRDVLDLIDLANRKGMRLVSMEESLDTTTAIGKCVMTIMAAIATLEREQTGERVRKINADRKSRGESCGFDPFGYRRGDDGKLEPVASEQEALAVIRKTWCETRSLERIRLALIEGGHKPRQVGWNGARVRLAWSGRYGTKHKAAARAKLGSTIPDPEACKALAQELIAAGAEPPAPKWSRGSILRVVRASFPSGKGVSAPAPSV